MKTIILIVVAIIVLGLIAIFTSPDDFRISLRTPSVTPSPGEAVGTPTPLIDGVLSVTPTPGIDIEIVSGTPTPRLDGSLKGGVTPTPKISRGEALSLYLFPISGNNLRGAATIIPQGNQTKVILTLDDKNIYDAQIRRGSCNNAGETLYQLNKVEGFSSTTYLNNNFSALESNLPLIMTISNNGILSCGSIEK